ncbi:MAG: alpha-galactosidase [Treponema sp.]|jgi:alpha-galactosidase|nr:alpha-galactosidase [Treponema sp.]
MIVFNNNIFRLQTENTEYIFRITKYGHLEQIYYGAKLALSGIDLNIDSLVLKRTAVPGGSIVAYDKEDQFYCLDTMCFEWSGIGKGDYRYSPAELKMPAGNFVTDFIYENHDIKEGIIPMKELPSAKGKNGDCASLVVNLKEKESNVKLSLIYTVYEKTNCITRRVVLQNNEKDKLVIRRLLSMSLDMPNSGFNLVTFDGDWAREAHRHDRVLQYGIFVNESRTGSSSNKHNPGFLLYENGAAEERGRVYGFNLVYSGNHFGFAELNSHDLVRAGIGISPHCFEWILKTGESFETPEAVITFSDSGFNGLSRNFHGFVNNHIVPEEWQGKDRPILYNSWEPCFFSFNQGKLMQLARQAKKLGMELFVLDDGWFEGRDNDKAGLGDYTPNKRKFPFGVGRFAKKIRKLGLEFGIWFEPEMINEDSNLFRAHPEWAVRLPGKQPVLGRNQLVLDLCNPQVRDYIVESVGKVLDETKASYVKWDMNRHISEFWTEYAQSQGEFYHRYIIGLYDIFYRIFLPRPHILLESCSSGGNRFDLGMMCISPQIWVSDNTDPVVRLDIQGGLSYLYPQSVMGAHVSDAPHQQTLRDTPLSTRYNVASFGCLGYELDLRFLSSAEKREIKDQIAFYKEHRNTFQYGIFERLPVSSNKNRNKTMWICKGKNNSIAGFFQTQAAIGTESDFLRIPGFENSTQYNITTKPQSLYIKRFGGLVKHLLPITLDPNGFILRTVNKYYSLTDCTENYVCTGETLAAGVMLNSQFMGSYYNNKTRLLGDYGSSLHLISPLASRSDNICA